jgi:hypothetical protein
MIWVSLTMKLMMTLKLNFHFYVVKQKKSVDDQIISNMLKA